MYIIGKEEIDAVRRVIESKQLFRYRGGEGGETDKFEAEWAATLGTKHAIAVTSGTAALICGLAGLDVGPGDEVIVPAYTWIATPYAALAVGAIPIVAEVDASLTLDPADLERKITSRTKAVVPVHMSGFPCNMDAIMDVARRHDLKVLEDACQADGGSYKGKRLGSIGLAGANSFNHFKIITCGEGGATVTSDQAVYHRALIHHDVGAAFREHADKMTVPIFASSNFRMNEILSAVLRVQLMRLEGILAALRKEKSIMRGELGHESAFSLNPSHDVEGDCGTTLAILFESRRDAQAFLKGMSDEGVPLGSPIDSGHHLYANWSPILEQRGAHHPARDPFKLCGYKVTYSKDMCPKTLDYLARTVYIATEVERPREALMNLVATVKRVARAKLVA